MKSLSDGIKREFYKPADYMYPKTQIKILNVSFFSAPYVPFMVKFTMNVGLSATSC